MKNRNADVLLHILSYCNEIEHTIRTFGREYDIFAGNSIYLNAVSMCVLQIGELTTHFTEDFKETYHEIPWNQMKALRNVVAHNYGKIEKEILWDTLLTDIPKLKNYCESIMKQYEALTQECLEDKEPEQEMGM